MVFNITFFNKQKYSIFDHRILLLVTTRINLLWFLTRLFNDPPQLVSYDNTLIKLTTHSYFFLAVMSASEIHENITTSSFLMKMFLIPSCHQTGIIYTIIHGHK